MMAEGFERRFEDNELTPAEAASRYKGREVRLALEAVWREGIAWPRRPGRWCLPGGHGGKLIKPEHK